MTAEPVTEAELVAQWEEAARARRLLLQRCEKCGVRQAYLRTVCASCQSSRLRLVEASGRAEVESFTWVHRAVFPGVAVPYAVARVRLVEGAPLLATIIEADEGSISCGDRVELVWQQGENDVPVPAFAPIGRDGRQRGAPACPGRNSGLG